MRNRRASDLARAYTLVCILISVIGCKEAPLAGLEVGSGPAVSDAELFARTSSPGGWVFYKFSPAPIVRSSTPHPESRALVRYNAVAATQLDAAGKVRAGASFPDSSVIVKELSNTTIETYAVMMKLRGSASAGFGGWIWAEFDRTGGTKYSTAGRGAACTACHSSGIDYTRMNDSHP